MEFILRLRFYIKIIFSFRNDEVKSSSLTYF